MNESNNLQAVKLKSPSELKHPDSRNLLVYSFVDLKMIFVLCIFTAPKNGLTTPNIKTFSMMTFSITTLSAMTLRITTFRTTIIKTWHSSQQHSA